jgi:hypothetical protein
MGDRFASENLIETDGQVEWLYRKRAILERLNAFFGGKETVGQQFGETHAPSA